MSTDPHVDLKDPIRSPVDGIMEWCPPGVWCSHGHGRCARLSPKDQANEPLTSLSRNRRCLQGSEVQKATLYLAEEAKQPREPDERGDRRSGGLRRGLREVREAEPKACVV